MASSMPASTQDPRAKERLAEERVTSFTHRIRFSGTPSQNAEGVALRVGGAARKTSGGASAGLKSSTDFLLTHRGGFVSLHTPRKPDDPCLGSLQLCMVGRVPAP
jgi:hypothetical protein